MNERITEVKEAVVEELVYSGSPFAVTLDGEGIFLNSRIVDKLKLKAGDSIQAYVVPNYPDKADQIRYRAMRVLVLNESNTMEPDDSVHKYLDVSLAHRIERLLKEEDTLWTLTEICEELAETEQNVYDTLETMSNVQSTRSYYIL